MWFRARETDLEMDRPPSPPTPDCAGSGGIDRTVASLNIEHYRRLLSEEQDEAKRRVIHRLLAEEEARLAALDKPPEAPDDER